MATSYCGTEENNTWRVVNNKGETLRHIDTCPRGTYKKGQLMDHFKGFKAAKDHARIVNGTPVRA